MIHTISPFYPMTKTLTTLLAALSLTTGCGGSQQPSGTTQPAAATQSEAETEAPQADSFSTPSGKTVRITALLHASLRIEYDGREIQIDPVGRLGDRTVDYAAMPKADYLLVTHEHGDHLDPAALDVLTTESTVLLTNARCAEQLHRGRTMANGDSLALASDIAVRAVPAYNTTEGHLQFHPRGRDNGYVLTLDGLRIYIAGDTEDIPEMADLGPVDVAFLPCNQPYTMTPTQLISAARTVRPRVLFPYHFGKTDLGGIAETLQADGIDVRIRPAFE